MRKTIEIDDDLYAALRESKNAKAVSMKVAVNEIMRIGIRKLNGSDISSPSDIARASNITKKMGYEEF